MHFFKIQDVSGFLFIKKLSSQNRILHIAIIYNNISTPHTEQWLKEHNRVQVFELSCKLLISQSEHSWNAVKITHAQGTKEPPKTSANTLLQGNIRYP